MKKLLIVLSSVRENRIADKVLASVRTELENYQDFEVSLADFRTTPLPFFDGLSSPTAPGFAAKDKNVQDWTSKVAKADAVLMLVAEYNHSYTAVLKNAVDWISPDIWNDKPIAFIGYGWVGGARATTNLRNLLTGFIKANPLETEANLSFTQEIDLEGNTLDAEAAKSAINAVLDSLMQPVEAGV